MVEKRFPRLENAPIIEALIDIQVRLEQDATVATLQEKIPESLSAKFSKREERKMIEAGFGQSAKGKVQVSATDHGTVGLLLRDDENQKVVQIRPDGFGFSHLQPYKDFDTFKSEAKELWGEYKTIANVKAITRIALLYINIIDFGKKVNSLNEFEKVLKTTPKAPMDVSVNVSTFFTQYQLNKSSNGLSAIVTQHTVQNVQTGFSGIKFQIDAFKMLNDEQSDEVLWSTVSDLRVFKNEIFFGSIDNSKIEDYRIVTEH